MALRRFDLEAGGKSFAFRPDTESSIAFWLAKYPSDKQRSAVIPLLWLAQKDNGGWLSEPAMRVVAERLEMPYIRVYEVATFYTMFRMQPVGRNHVQLCGTTPCQLRGAEALKEVCQLEIGKQMFVTDDQRLSWEEVECLGACVNAPVVQINDNYFEDLTPQSLQGILTRLRNGAEVQPGPQIDRINSAPVGGATVLTDPRLFDGTRNQSGALPNLPGIGQTQTGLDAPPAPEPAKTTLLPRTVGTDTRPSAGSVEPAGRDNLKRIKGIGPKNEESLNDLGILTFAQIAAWSPADIDWIESQLSFPDRVGREDWVGQAARLAAGEDTEFSRRVDAGDVASSKDEDA